MLSTELTHKATAEAHGRYTGNSSHGTFPGSEPRQFHQEMEDWTHIFIGEFESRAEFCRKGKFDKSSQRTLFRKMCLDSNILRFQGIKFYSDQLSRGPGASPMNTWVKSYHTSWEPSLGSCSGPKLISSSLRGLGISVLLLLLIWFHSISPAIFFACTWPNIRSTEPYKSIPVIIGFFVFFFSFLCLRFLKERKTDRLFWSSLSADSQPALNQFYFFGWGDCPCSGHEGPEEQERAFLLSQTWLPGSVPSSETVSRTVRVGRRGNETS